MGKSMHTSHLNDGIDGHGQMFPSCIWGFGFFHTIDYHHWRSSLKRMLLRKINPRKRLIGKSRVKELDHDVGELQKLLNEDEKSFPSAKESGTKQKRSRGKNSKEVKNKDVLKDEVKRHANVLEIFKVNEHLFLENLLDTDDGLGKFSHTLPGSRAKARLTKSGSYPAAHLLQKRDPEPSTLKQKQSENWPAPKEKLNTVSVIPKAEKFKYSVHKHSKFLPSENSIRSSNLGQVLNFILESTTESDERNTDILVPFKESKQSNQCAEKKGEHEVSNGSSGPENNSDKRCWESANCRNDKRNSLSSNEAEEHCFSRSAQLHRRSSSLNYSLDKYSSLFGNDFGKEVELGSRSLRLRNEYEMGLGENASILLGRIRSLSNLQSYSSFQNGVHDDANLKDWPITTVEESSSYTDVNCQEELKRVGNSPSTEEVAMEDIQESTKEYDDLESVDTVNQLANLAGTAEMSTIECAAGVEDLDNKADSLMVGNSISFREKENSCSAIAPSEFVQPCSVPAVETNFKEVPSSLVEFQESEGLENSCLHFDDDSSINCEKNSFLDSSSSSSIVQNLKTLYNMKDADFGGFYKKHDTDLDYEKDFLEYSGFAWDALQKTWFSSNQPLGPSTFDEIEAYWHKELECYEEDYYGCYHHQLIFDIVNEKLLNMYDRSSTYYPKALSSSCHISPFPKGYQILDEMFRSINKLTSLKLEQKQSLECMVSLDMGKDDGWMNLQLETECLSLELEDMIFDELMEEAEEMILGQVFGSSSGVN